MQNSRSSDNTAIWQQNKTTSNAIQWLAIIVQDALPFESTRRSVAGCLLPPDITAESIQLRRAYANAVTRQRADLAKFRRIVSRPEFSSRGVRYSNGFLARPRHG
jgi:hypothetical protein